MLNNSAKEGFGVVQLGEVTAYGKWNETNEHLEISFDSQSLSLDKQRELEQYHAASIRIQVQIPSDRKPVRGLIIGFQRDHVTARFDVSRDVPAVPETPLPELRGRRQAALPPPAP